MESETGLPESKAFEIKHHKGGKINSIEALSNKYWNHHSARSEQQIGIHSEILANLLGGWWLQQIKTCPDPKIHSKEQGLLHWKWIQTANPTLQ